MNKININNQLKRRKQMKKLKNKIQILILLIHMKMLI